MQFPITIGLHRSRFLDAMLVLAALLATAVTMVFPCTPSIRSVLLLAVLIMAIQAWHALAPTITAIRLERNGDIFIARLGEGEFVPATPQPRATIHPWLIVIRLVAADGRPAKFIATVNRKNSQNLKRLRMFMRWQANFSVPEDDA